MRQKEKAARLLRRYLSGNATSSEKEQVDQWYSAYEEKPVELHAGQKERLQDEMFANIERRVRQSPVISRYRVLKPLTGIAASLLFIATATFFIYHPIRQISSTHAYDMIKTRPDERKQVILDDGTEVVLQPGSSLKYPTNMRSGSRLVELVQGEAFFKVVHDPKRPFRVKMPEGLYTQVLGTSFTIKAYPRMTVINVTVNTGRIAVGRGNRTYSTLTKGQSLTYNRTLQSFDTYKPLPEIKTAIRFDDTPLAELSRKLENSYDVAIEIPDDPKIRRLKCTGSFDSGQDIKEVLQTICLLHGLKLHYQPDLQTFKITKP